MTEYKRLSPHDVSCAGDITQALREYKVVELSAGQFDITEAIELRQWGNKLFGQGKGKTIINVKNKDAHGIVFPKDVMSDQGEVGGLTVTRSCGGVEPVGSGIVQARTLGRPRIQDVLSEEHKFGFVLGSTDDGEFLDNEALQNWYHGVYMMNTGMALQWSSRRYIARLNGWWGALIEANPHPDTPAGVALGTWENTTTYANGHGGLAFVGVPGHPAHQPRVEGGFIGGDNSYGIYFNTYSEHVYVGNVAIEVVGLEPCGRKWEVAPQGGVGISIDHTHQEAYLSNVRIQNTGTHGIVCTAARVLQVNGAQLLNTRGAGIVADAQLANVLTNINSRGCQRGIWAGNPNLQVLGGAVFGQVQAIGGAAQDPNLVRCIQGIG